MLSNFKRKLSVSVSLTNYHSMSALMVLLGLSSCAGGEDGPSQDQNTGGAPPATGGQGAVTTGGETGSSSGGSGGSLATGGTNTGTPSGGSEGASGGASAGGASTSAGGASTSGGTSAGGAATGGQQAGGSGGDGTGGTTMGGTESPGCGTTPTLMNGRKTISSDGMDREYILRVPDDYDNTHPYRLVMAYHWLSGNASQVANGGEGGSTDDPYYGLWDLAEGSTIFVAPEGLDAGWANSGDRDIALTDAILDELQNDLCIDKSRIFATGFSYGAGMSYALACARADVFRGVALYAGAQLSGCNGGSTPIAYFHAHGVSDSVLSVSQGRQLRDNFVGVNGCTSQTINDTSSGSGTHSCTSYEGCSEGYPVRWCAHGGDHNPTEKDSGESKSWIPPEAWDFISQF